ncbi:hypothetical protein AB3662_07305 [Sorangium cellulosum]|uniref:hypothetical protein n=1 Tax=Sorangium cellulosum TaxID=56 RepID=UPI003D9A232D
MIDPERLLDKKEGDLQTALLRAALDESPPSSLTRRTLAALGVATAATLAGGAARAGAGGAAASSGGAAVGSAAAGGAAAGAALNVAGAASGGGILSAFGIGALAGVLTLGVVQWTGVTAPARRSQEAPTAPAAPVYPPARAPAALAPPPTSGAAAAEPQHVAEERARVDDGPPLSRPAAPGRAAPDPAALAKAAPAASGPRAPERNPSTLASELALLDTARRALRSGDPAAAVALLDRHAREFAGAQLADEAAAIRVEALASKGDRAGARAAARRFLEAHPGSPHVDRVESAAGIGAREETVIRRSDTGD